MVNWNQLTTHATTNSKYCRAASEFLKRFGIFKRIVLKYMKEKNIDKFTNIILESITDGVFTVDKEWRITSFNKAAEEITGILRDEALGQRCSDVFRASVCEAGCVLRQTMKTGKPVLCKTLYIVNADGEKVTVSVSTALLKDSDGKIIGGVETFRDLRAMEMLKKAITRQYSFSDIISKNAEMQKLFGILPQIAQSNSTVLIQGESGVGKELVARVLHQLSPRSKKKIVAINCSALPDTLLESELFGYKAGAFTDARKDKKGRFAQAEGGTLFLDEIGDISPALQAKLLRVLQEKEYEPLGGTKTLKADVRIIAATNKNLQQLAATGRFRDDLYYRLNIVKLTLPSLADRREDIPLLIEHFIRKFNAKKAKNINAISPAALAILMQHDFPGNIRELENIIEHAFVICRDPEIKPQHLPADLFPHAPQPNLDDDPKPINVLRQQSEAEIITNTLRQHQGNRTLTAAQLGINKSTLWRKMKKYNISYPTTNNNQS